MNEKAILAEIAALNNELAQKVSERDSLNVAIMRLEEKIRALNRSFLTDALAEKGRQLTAVGLTEAIRILLRKHGKPMTAADVKLGLELLGFELDRFKNPSSTVHNTLIRMQRAGELYYSEAAKTYGITPLHPAYRLRNRNFYGEVPNPLGKNLAEMLKEPKK